MFMIPTGSFAQSNSARNPCFNTGAANPNCISVGTNDGLPVAGSEFDVSVTPVIQNAAYSSGNAIGGLQTISVFRNSYNPEGILNNISVWSKGGSTTAITFYIFHSNPVNSTCTDKSAFSLNANDVSKLITSIPPVLTPAVVGVGTTATVASQQLPISVKNQDSPSTINLYVCAVVGGTVTPASVSDLIFNYSGIQD